jgi:hypothetical protein
VATFKQVFESGNLHGLRDQAKEIEAKIGRSPYDIGPDHPLRLQLKDVWAKIASHPAKQKHGPGFLARPKSRAPSPDPRY